MSENKISITSNNSYAQALFELANEDKSLTKVEEQVIAISKLINESEEFRYLIKNPTTSIEDLTRVIETISENQLEPNVCGSTPVQLMNIFLCWFLIILQR